MQYIVETIIETLIQLIVDGLFGRRRRKDRQ